jgi:protein-tyrosine kinase
MEKIHSAILKARQEREARLQRGTQEAPAKAAAPEPTAEQEAHDDVAAAWAGLEQYKPDRRSLARNRIVAFEPGPSSICYDVLRTNILRQMRANGWKRLAITSPTPGCGKTTTALNLGFSLGRLRDLHTIVVEVDLRRPAIRDCLRERQRHMFAAVLAGEAKASDHLTAFGKTLAFGSNHAPVKNSAELLSSDQVKLNLAELDRQFAPDITIFDMTPMLVSDDTIAFLSNVDCVLLVAAAGVTTTAQVDRCERELAEQTNVLGVVLNKCQFITSDEDYSYDY